MKISLITGTAGDIQGWGNIETTHALEAVLKSSGKQVEIFFATGYEGLCHYLQKRNFDMIWSSLYHITEKEDSIEVPLNEKWVQDYLEIYEIPYIGSSASSLKMMLNKQQTSIALSKKNVPVPAQFYIDSVESVAMLTELEGQFIVKPCYGSNSTGVDETSVVRTPEKLIEKVTSIITKLDQPVVVEEYLPGDEYTVLVLGNHKKRHLYSVVNSLRRDSYQDYPIITSNLKYKHGIEFHKPDKAVQAMAEDVAERTAVALDCRDHVRIDMRMDHQGEIKVIDVNGIPGLSPVLGSRSLAIQELYHPQYSKAENYSRLISQTVDSAMQRYSGDMFGLLQRQTMERRFVK